MATVSFKTDEQLKQKLDALAKRKGINVSAYIKLLLNKEIAMELGQLTPNGLTVAEELAILVSHESDPGSKSFKTIPSLLKALKA